MLKRNPGKTKVLHFIPRFMKQPSFGDSITFAGTEINITKKARNLGVIMDNNLSSSSHINEICKKSTLAIRSITLGPTHPQKRSRAAWNVIRVKLKMAENVFVGLNPPLRGIYRFLQRNVHDYLKRTILQLWVLLVNSLLRWKPQWDFWRKNIMISRGTEVQQLVGTQSMVINALKKIDEKIDGRLHTTASMATS